MLLPKVYWDFIIKSKLYRFLINIIQKHIGLFVCLNLPIIPTYLHDKPIEQMIADVKKYDVFLLKRGGGLVGNLDWCVVWRALCFGENHGYSMVHVLEKTINATCFVFCRKPMSTFNEATFILVSTLRNLLQPLPLLLLM